MINSSDFFYKANVNMDLKLLFISASKLGLALEAEPFHKILEVEGPKVKAEDAHGCVSSVKA